MFHYIFDSNDVTGSLPVISQTPCVSMETKVKLAKMYIFRANVNSPKTLVHIYVFHSLVIVLMIAILHSGGP